MTHILNSRVNCRKKFICHNFFCKFHLHMDHTRTSWSISLDFPRTKVLMCQKCIYLFPCFLHLFSHKICNAPPPVRRRSFAAAIFNVQKYLPMWIVCGINCVTEIVFVDLKAVGELFDSQNVQKKWGTRKKTHA